MLSEQDAGLFAFEVPECRKTSELQVYRQSELIPILTS
jgi:hypothetical protein